MTLPGAEPRQFREALAKLKRALGLVLPLAGKNSDDYKTLSCIAWLYYKSGDLELRTAGIAAAFESYDRGLKVAQQIKTDLQDPHIDELLLNGYLRMATAKTRMSAAKEALTYAQLASEAADRSARRGGQDRHSGYGSDTVGPRQPPMASRRPANCVGALSGGGRVARTD